MKKRFSLLLLALLLTSPLLAKADVTSEAGEENYAIHIVKYQITADKDFSSEMVHDGSEITNAKDMSGHPLSPLAGVSYTITRMKEVKHIGTTSTYEVADGKTAFSMRVTTDANGFASVLKLAKGIYRVTEEKSDLVESVMEPVMMRLPMQHETGYLKEVYIYPKSNMKLPDSFMPSSPTNPPTTDTPDRLFNTSGNIGSYQQLIWMIVSFCVAGIIGLTISNRRHRMN
ncbi:hypothetical protein FACS1894193_08400 [Bacilli bacterium]|nr:hypothetical protein FACS1894192_11690 [Bacilli bacterium]GHU42666.1 hypothetical protein FACS1894193_08400 [Bacilli bacterium]